MKTMSVKVFTRIACLIMAVAMAVSLVGCGVDITSVGLPTDIVLEKGETKQLNIEYGTDDKAEQEKIAEAASKLNLTWSSSDETVATVDETGLVTAVGAGEADVTVSVADANISSTTHIKVVILPTGVEAPETLSLELNGEATKALGAKMTPEDATDVKLAYLSSDESVVTVDESGNVTAVGVGECTITTTIVADTTATAEDAGVDSEMLVVPENAKAETKVTVTTKVEQIALSKTEGVLTVGNSVTITATVTPDNATNATVNWTSSDEKVATVDSNGKVTAVAAGNATITATSESDGDVSADYALTVNKAAAKPATIAELPVPQVQQPRRVTLHRPLLPRPRPLMCLHLHLHRHRHPLQTPLLLLLNLLSRAVVAHLIIAAPVDLTPILVVGLRAPVLTGRRVRLVRN